MSLYKHLPSCTVGGAFSVCMVLSGQLSAGKINIPNDRHLGFSGIEYHVPRNTRMVLYKYKAQKNRSLAEGTAVEADTRGILEMSDSLRRVQAIDSDVVADCSISIGNNTKPDIFAPKEQVVIIEGDVVNLGNCDN